VVEHERALHQRSADEDQACVDVWLRGVVLGHRSTEHDARTDVQARQDVVHDGPADVLEVHVDAVGGGRVEPLAPVCVLVIDAGVEAEILDHVATLRL
jgi:hypothetical protein